MGLKILTFGINNAFLFPSINAKAVSSFQIQKNSTSSERVVRKIEFFSSFYQLFSVKV